jgi:membrane fusion protein, multidrug efflux system
MPMYVPERLSRSARRLALLAGVVSTLFALAGCGGSSSASAPPAMPPKAVSAATAIARDVPQYLDADGVTTAFQSVNIVSQVEGQIVDMPFRQGALVKKDDLLLKIDQRPFTAALDKADGQVVIDQANVKLAESLLERSNSLLAKKYISQQQYDTYAAQVDSMRGQLQVDQAQDETAKINLDYTNITAPVDGMVGTYRINVGNVVKVNDAPITTIQTMDPIYADFVVSESDFPSLRERFDANGGKLTVHIVSLSDPKAQRDGDLTILGNAISTPTGSVSLRATLSNADLMFWPNQPIRAHILLNTLPNAVLIPESAVQLSQQGEYVFVIVPSATPGQPPTVEQRSVVSGQTQDDGLKVIASGLKAGEQVVVLGQIFLMQGMPVMITELDGQPTTPPAAATAPAAK